MKILHTADWHLGQELAGWPRATEHAAFFAHLEETIAAKRPDALIVAGDVFDHQNPSAEAQRNFFEAMVRFRKIAPTMATVVIAGNHDAAGRIEAPRAVLQALGVHVLGGVARCAAGRLLADRHVVTVTGPNGDRLGVIAPTPFLRPIDLPARPTDCEGSPIVAQARSLYAEVFELAAASASGLPVVLTGHLHVSGAMESEGAERRILVGGEHAVPHDIFPEEAAYVALGHLHRPQQVGRATVRYSGSAFPMSATERNYDHGVTLIAFENYTPRIEHLAFPRHVPFLRVPSSGAAAVDAVEGLLRAQVERLGLEADTPAHQRPFIQLVLNVPPGSAARNELERLKGEFPVRIVAIVVESQAAPESAAPLPTRRLGDIDPETLFRAAFERRHTCPPEPVHLDVFHAAAEAET